MRARVMILAAVAAATAIAAPADARKKKDTPPPVPARPAPIIALPASANATTVNYFYERRREAPIWFTAAGGEAAINELLETLRRAPVEGYTNGPQVAAQVQALVERAKTGDAVAIKTAERGLSNAWVDYVQFLERPNNNVIWGDPALKLKPDHPDRIMALLAAAPSIQPHIKSVAMVNPIYAGLREVAIQEAAANGGTPSTKVTLNMDRARILPATGKFIFVNTAEQRLHMYEGTHEVGSMKVVVGSKDKYNLPTPIIASTMYYAIANPYWYVPEHLVRKVAANVSKQGPAYLKARGYEVISDLSGNAQVLPPSSVDWKAVAAGTTKVYIRQEPGGANSMGRMKFPFPNPEGIFLHDTPMKNYFEKSDRSLSNGCIRLEDYRRLAHWVFGRDPETVGKAPEQPMALPGGIPVYATYLTMVPGEAGMVSFADRYGWDQPGVVAGGIDVAASRAFSSGMATPN